MFYIVTKEQIFEQPFESFEQAKRTMLINNIQGKVLEEEELNHYINWLAREKEIEQTLLKRQEDLERKNINLPFAGSTQNYYYKTFKPKAKKVIYKSPKFRMPQQNSDGSWS